MENKHVAGAGCFTLSGSWHVLRGVEFGEMTKWIGIFNLGRLCLLGSWKDVWKARLVY